MKYRLMKQVAVILVFTIGMTGSLPRAASVSDTHLVNPQELQSALRTAAEEKEGQIQRIQAFLASEPGKKVLDLAEVESGQVEAALPALSREELADLAAKTTEVQDRFGAGHYHDVVTLLVIGILVIAIIILIDRTD